MKRAVERNHTPNEFAETKPARSISRRGFGVRVRHMAFGPCTWIAGDVGRVCGAFCCLRAGCNSQKQPTIGTDIGIPGFGGGWLIRPDFYSRAASHSATGRISER